MPKTPEQITAQLRAPIEPAHGIWELHRRYADALALLLMPVKMMEPSAEDIYKLLADSIRDAEAAMEYNLRTVFYGSGEWMPVVFSGYEPLWSHKEIASEFKMVTEISK